MVSGLVKHNNHRSLVLDRMFPTGDGLHESSLLPEH
jgi:hypothetical protein